jgi:glutathione synthase/RimK-type ligase-like ATP-grasp enzyme
LRRAFPSFIRDLGGSLLPWEAYQRHMGTTLRPLRDRSGEAPVVPVTDVTLGIIPEFSSYHVHFVEACRDLGVPYKLVDISGPDWLDDVRNADCDAFIVRPPGLVRLWKERCDERLRIMVRELGVTIYPSYDEIWLYESKRRTHYWLEANKVPHVRSWIFYDREDALEFAETCELPVVLKSDFGSGAAGVWILRSRTKLRRHIGRIFSRGLHLRHAHPLERQWGNVLLQEYVPKAREWRAIRIGRSFFALEKLKRGDFHSGSGSWSFDDPPLRLMDFTRDLTEAAGFTSMGVDILESSDGEYLVNELHTVFASPSPHKLRVGGEPGRYLYNDSSGQWEFEKGTFCQNACCNLRVEALLELLERGKE